MTFIPGVVFLFLSRGAKRGRPLACRVATYCIASLMFGVGLATAVWCAGAIVWGFGLFVGHAEPAALFHLMVFPIGAGIVLLFKDLIALLRWIVRNPFQEKPPVLFMPQLKSQEGGG